MKIGIIGSGSWATAIVKILNDNKKTINWWIRSQSQIASIQKNKNNPKYLSSIIFNTKYLNLYEDLETVVKQSDVLICVIPSAYIEDALKQLPKDCFKNKKIVSAIKGIIPTTNVLLNEFLETEFAVSPQDYFTIMGPCHAEEIGIEKLSYLTFSGIQEIATKEIAAQFKNKYLNTIINNDVWGVQYSAVLKNIYALGAGIAHGLHYGDNFMSVYNANCAKELSTFLQKLYVYKKVKNIYNHNDSVYLGDLLVTCYSPYSRNREFGSLLGKGYSVRSAQLEMNMVAEGYNTSKCIFNLNKKIKADLPIIENIYQIVWNNMEPAKGFKNIEKMLQ